VVNLVSARGRSGRRPGRERRPRDYGGLSETTLRLTKVDSGRAPSFGSGVAQVPSRHGTSRSRIPRSTVPARSWPHACTYTRTYRTHVHAPVTMRARATRCTARAAPRLGMRRKAAIAKRYTTRTVSIGTATSATPSLLDVSPALV